MLLHFYQKRQIHESVGGHDAHCVAQDRRRVDHGPKGDGIPLITRQARAGVSAIRVGDARDGQIGCAGLAGIVNPPLVKGRMVLTCQSRWMIWSAGMPPNTNSLVSG